MECLLSLSITFTSAENFTLVCMDLICLQKIAFFCYSSRGILLANESFVQNACSLAWTTFFTLLAFCCHRYVFRSELPSVLGLGVVKTPLFWKKFKPGMSFDVIYQEVYCDCRKILSPYIESGSHCILFYSSRLISSFEFLKTTYVKVLAQVSPNIVILWLERKLMHSKILI